MYSNVIIRTCCSFYRSHNSTARSTLFQSRSLSLTGQKLQRNNNKIQNYRWCASLCVLSLFTLFSVVPTKRCSEKNIRKIFHKHQFVRAQFTFTTYFTRTRTQTYIPTNTGTNTTENRTPFGKMVSVHWNSWFINTFTSQYACTDRIILLYFRFALLILANTQEQ